MSNRIRETKLDVFLCGPMERGGKVLIRCGLPFSLYARRKSEGKGRVARVAGEDDNLIASSAKKKRKEKRKNERKARPALELMFPFKTRRLDYRFASENCLAVFRWASTIRVIQLAMGSSLTPVACINFALESVVIYFTEFFEQILRC